VFRVLKFVTRITGSIAINILPGTQITVASPRLDVRHSFTLQVYVKVASTSADLQAGLMMSHRPVDELNYVSYCFEHQRTFQNIHLYLEGQIGPKYRPEVASLRLVHCFHHTSKQFSVQNVLIRKIVLDHERKRLASNFTYRNVGFTETHT